jgi:hypothetical protein
MPHQLDGNYYEKPLDTEPFRFDGAEDDATRKYFTSADPQYLPFGLGMLCLHLLQVASTAKTTQESTLVQDASLPAMN